MHFMLCLPHQLHTTHTPFRYRGALKSIHPRPRNTPPSLCGQPCLKSESAPLYGICSGTFFRNIPLLGGLALKLYPWGGILCRTPLYQVHAMGTPHTQECPWFEQGTANLLVVLHHFFWRHQSGKVSEQLWKSSTNKFDQNCLQPNKFGCLQVVDSSKFIL